jgi:energy-coupling factor transporter ATP-binding protein EcfA2
MTHGEQAPAVPPTGPPRPTEPTTGPIAAAAGPATLLGALQQLRRGLTDLRLDLELPGVDAARADRQAMVAQLDDYVLPRLQAVDAPLLAVVGGSTGAGKSTLVNSLLGFPASRSGVIRPTTRAPALIHHPADAGYFTDQRILPGLARSNGPVVLGDNEPIRAVQLISTEAVPQGLAILDAPDIDSVVGTNRALATQLLAAADLWIFVTTAARYADAVPWDFLAGAAARQAAVAIVLDRVPPEATNDIAGHLQWMLGQNGLGASPLFVIPEVPLDGAGLLPPAVVQPLKGWLGGLASDAVARHSVVRQTLTGAVEAMLGRVRALAGAANDQRRAIAALARQVDEVYADGARKITEDLADGSLLRSEVLARWQEFLGTGEFMRNLESRIGRLRDRMVSAISGRPRQEQQVAGALQSGVEQLIGGQAELAADEVMRRWRHQAGGAALADRRPDLAASAPGLPDRVSRTVRDWQAGVLELVRTEGKDKRTGARMLSYGVNGTGVLLMLVTFSQTAGLTGAEVGIAGGTAVLAQRLLEAAFGDQAVRTLVSQARKDLVGRGEQILTDDRARLGAVLAELSGGPTPADLERLAGAVAMSR